MKLKMTMIGMIFIGIGLLAARTNGAESATFKSDKEKISYSLGVDVGKNLKQLGKDLDLDLLTKAIKNVFAGEKLLMSDADIQATLAALGTELRQNAEKAQKAKGEENRKKGEVFLAENKKKKDVVTLPSGLQYKIIKAGNGKKPTLNDTVEVNYKGSLIDGTVFDASPEGKPLSIKLQQVIPGWTEALQLMPVGSKWELFIPSQLAYGERGAGQVIAPNSTLIFEVELLAIK